MNLAQHTAQMNANNYTDKTHYASVFTLDGYNKPKVYHYVKLSQLISMVIKFNVTKIDILKKRQRIVAIGDENGVTAVDKTWGMWGDEMDAIEFEAEANLDLSRGM